MRKCLNLAKHFLVLFLSSSKIGAETFIPPDFSSFEKYTGIQRICAQGRVPCELYEHEGVGNYEGCIDRSKLDLCCPPGWIYVANTYNYVQTCVKSNEDIENTEWTHDQPFQLQCSDDRMSVCNVRSAGSGGKSKYFCQNSSVPCGLQCSRDRKFYCTLHGACLTRNSHRDCCKEGIDIDSCLDEEDHNDGSTTTEKTCHLEASSDDTLSPKFSARNVLEDGCDASSFQEDGPIDAEEYDEGPGRTKDEDRSDDAEGEANFWLSSDVRRAMLSLDLGCVQVIHNMSVRNTHNGPLNDRGTKFFSVAVSISSPGTWILVIIDKLSDPRDKGCDVPLDVFQIENKVSGRYVRFFVEDFYGLGGGLQFLQINGPSVKKIKTKTGDITVAIGVGGLGILLLIAFIICCIRNKSGSRNPSDNEEENPGIFTIKDRHGNELSDEHIKTCCGCLLDRDSRWGQYLQEFRRWHGSEVLGTFRWRECWRNRGT